MDTIDRVRSFNRFYTRQIGLVERSYLGSGLSLSDVRVLYELTQPSPLTARALATDLGLDEGYVSRILAKFQKSDWLARSPDPTDARKSILELTKTGRAQAELFAQQSRNSIGEMLSGLSAADHARLGDAMGTVEHVLSRDGGDVVLRDLEIGDIGWLVQKHGELYASEEGFDRSFEVLVAEILVKFFRNRDPENERAFIAEMDGQRLGSVFCERQSDDVAKLRLFLLVPEARGLGLGRQLLEACLSFARARGYKKLTLWTHKSHEAACALYAIYGFTVANEEPVREFGCDLIRQNWEIDLTTPLAFELPQG